MLRLFDRSEPDRTTQDSTGDDAAGRRTLTDGLAGPTASTPSFWQRLRTLNFDGTNRVVDASAPSQAAPAPAAAPADVGTGTATAAGSASTTPEGIQLAGNANATARIVDGRVAIHAGPLAHELFGETVTARFDLGVDASVLAQASGSAALDVQWDRLAAHAQLSGVASGAANLVGAASLGWTKRSPAQYAQQIATNPTWRSIVARLLPSWVTDMSPDDAAAPEWLEELVGLVIDGSGGDVVILGATTAATARARLGLPQLALEGGALQLHGVAGLAFDGASATVDLELGRTQGLELVAVLAFHGATELLDRLDVASLIPGAFAARLDRGRARLLAIRDRARAIDGDHHHSWSARAEGQRTGELSYTRDGKQPGVLTTGDAARTDDAAQTARAEAAEHELGGTRGALHSLAKTALGSNERTLASGDTGELSAHLIDPRSVAIGDPKRLHGTATAELLGVAAQAGGEVAVSADDLRVGGNANATATLARGAVDIAIPDTAFDLLGERMTGRFRFTVDAGAFAEARGTVNANLGWTGAGVDVSLSGFAGARASATATGSLTWTRRSVKDYSDAIIANGAWKQLLGNVLPSWLHTEWVEHRLESWIEKLVQLVMAGGDAGDALLLGATATASASAGIGADAVFSAGLRGGVLHAHGRAGITFGVGAGADVDLALSLADGASLLGLLALRGSDELLHRLRPDLDLGAFLRQRVGQLRHAS